MTFAEPTGLFSGLFDACVVSVPAFSPLSFLGERHSLAQWPGLPQLWHLPLRCLHFPSSDAVAARASSVVESFFPPCPFARQLFNQSASLQIWLIRASISMGDDPLMIRAEDSRCDAKVASSLGIPFRMVHLYSFSVTDTPAVASSSRLQHRLARKSCTSPPLAHCISRNACWRSACAYVLLAWYSLLTKSHHSLVVEQFASFISVMSGSLCKRR